MQSRRLLRLLALAAALAGASPCVLAQAAKKEREAAAAPGQLSSVGQGKTLARKGLEPGAYIGMRHRKAVQDWLKKNHAPGKRCLPGLEKRGDACAAPEGLPAWTIGEALPAQAPVAQLPQGLQRSLPRAPPGNRYVLLGGDILLMAAGSRVVVDAVPLQ